MIRHISVLTLKETENKLENIELLIKKLEDVANKCNTIKYSQVKKDISKRPPEDFKGKPIFGDVVQIIDFATKEDSEIYPMSEAHMDLLKETSEMIETVTSTDFEF